MFFAIKFALFQGKKKKEVTSCVSESDKPN